MSYPWPSPPCRGERRGRGRVRLLLLLVLMQQVLAALVTPVVRMARMAMMCMVRVAHLLVTFGHCLPSLGGAHALTTSCRM